MNLLDETKDALKSNDKTPNDVEWIGNIKTYSITWERICKNC